MPWYTTADARRDAEMQAAITDRDASRKLGNKPDRTRKARAAKARALAIENGGAQISTLIGPDAAVRLAEIRRAESMTLRQAIESAILNYPINGSSVTSSDQV